ncbi:MAG TPA: hypothetical protein VFM94_09850 [Solirubrobacterales bacterium]|nr:hypothetical protein [Solirubrobacterales bacterium]
MTERQARDWLSEARFRPFLERCDYDHERAVALYEKHILLTATSFELIHRFEVLVRNTIDATLGYGQPDIPLTETWLFDPEILSPYGISQVVVAVNRVEKDRRATRGQVIAGLSFAFWAALFGRKYEELWRRQLRSAFPHAPLMRKDLSLRMRLLRRFRNRVAHHDSLLNQDVAARLEDMLVIAGWIDPAAREWLSSGHGNALEIARDIACSTEVVRG